MSTTQSEAGALRRPSVEAIGPDQAAKLPPDQAIVWAKSYRWRWQTIAAENANRDSGWSEKEARQAASEIAKADAIELAAVYALLDGVSPAAVRELADVCEAIVDDREACGIDETDTDDPLALIVKRARTAVSLAMGGA